MWRIPAWVLALGGCVAAASLGPGVAEAAADPMIHACVNRAGQIRIVRPARIRCRRKETRLDWRKAAFASSPAEVGGPTGAHGPTGARGPTGTRGPTGLQGA